MKPKDLLTESKYIFIASIILAFVFPGFASPLKVILIPLLVIMMTFSIKDVHFHHIKKVQAEIICSLLLFNYVLLTGMYFLLTSLFIHQEAYRNALYVLAMMPPAVGILSLSYILKGDINISFVTEFMGYLLALILVPVLSNVMFGNAVSPVKIFKVLLYIVIIPFALSRIIKTEEHKHIIIRQDWVKSIVNLCYGLSFYIVIGINKDVLLNNLNVIAPIVLLLVFVKFVVGTTILMVLKSKTKQSLDVLYILFGTLKNGSAAIAITILLFGEAATLPLAVNGIVSPFYIIFLEWFVLEEFA